MALFQYELKKCMNAIPVTKASQRSVHDKKKSFKCNIFSTASACRKQLQIDELSNAIFVTKLSDSKTV